MLNQSFYAAILALAMVAVKLQSTRVCEGFTCGISGLAAAIISDADPCPSGSVLL